MKEMKKDRRFGKAADTEELQREVRKRKVSRVRFVVVRNRNKKNLDSKFETKPKPLASETDHTVFDGRKVFHKKDKAEILITVIRNHDMLQAKEILERVSKKEKEVTRGEKGRFSSKGKKETVAARGGRQIKLRSSLSKDETLAATGRRTKGSASRTGTTPTKKPPVSGTAGDTTVTAT